MGVGTWPTTSDVTSFDPAPVHYGHTLIGTSSSVPNVIWQNTSSNATYASAANIITNEGKVLKRQGAVYR